jgi:hypothetical protein
VLALAVVAFWSLAEGFLFFIVADVPISFVALRYGIRRALVAALIAAPAAALGGLAMVLWTQADPAAADRALILLPGIDGGTIHTACHHWIEDDYLAMAEGAFGGVPYKPFAHAYGLDPTGSLAAFFAGSVAARLPRFMLMALVVGLIGRWLEHRLAWRWRLAILAGCWTGFYGWYFAVMPR